MTSSVCCVLHVACTGFAGSRASDRVRETLVRDSTVAPVMRGYYRVEGVGPNGVAYRGVCFVPYMGDTSSTNPFCRLRHHLGVTLTNGFGQRKGDEFRYDWKAMGVTGVMNLQLELDGSLHGRGDNGERSNWTPVTEAQGIPTDDGKLFAVTLTLKSGAGGVKSSAGKTVCLLRSRFLKKAIGQW